MMRMQTKRCRVFLTSVILTLALLLTLGAVHPIHAAPRLQEGGDAKLRIINESEETICYVLVCHPDTENLADCPIDTLTTIAPGRTRDFAITTGNYDVLLGDCENYVLLTELELTIMGQYELLVSVSDDFEPYAKIKDCGSADCVMSVIEFFRIINDEGDKGQAFMVFIEEMGNVDLAGIFYPNMANSNFQHILINGTPRIIRANGYDLIIDSLLQDDSLYLSLRQIFPNISLWIWNSVYQGTQELPSGGQRFIFSYPLTDECRACDILAHAFVSFDFNNEGQFEGVNLITLVEPENYENAQANLEANVAPFDIQSPVFAPGGSESILRALSTPPNAEDCEGLGQAGNDLYYSNQWREAIIQYQLALTCYQDADEYRGQSITLNNLGKIYDGWSQYGEALLHYEQALAIARQIEDQRGEAVILDNIGGVYSAQGKYSKALTYYEQSLSIDHVVGNRSGEGRTLNNIGVTYHTQGLYGKALKYFGRALALHREMGNPICEGSTLHNMGSVYRSQGRYGEALEYYEQALAIGRKARDLIGEGERLNSIGVVYHTQGQYQEALIHFVQALAIRREVEDQIGEATTLHNIGEAHYAQHQYDNAMVYYMDALTIWQETERQIETTTTLNSIGVLYDAEGKYEEALTVFEQALTISREIDNKATQGVILENVGWVYNSMGNYMEALTHYEQAMTIVESLRATAGSEAGRASFIAQYAHLYDWAINLYHTQEQDADAFYTSERGRARAFLDTMATGYVQLSDDADADLLAREQIAYAARRAARDALTKARAQQSPDDDLIADLEAQLAEAEAEHAAALDAIESRGDQLAALVPGRSAVLDLDQVQALLDNNTTLLSYWVTENRTLAFVVTKDSLKTATLPISRTTLSTQIRGFRSFANLNVAHPENAVALYNTLIAPIEEHLTTSHLTIIPHNVLHYLPFAALTDGERYLVDDYTLSYLPSASVLPFIDIASEETAGSPLILGNPTTADYDASALVTERDKLRPLPFAEEEAQAIAKLYEADALVREAATESIVREQAGASTILHLAAHGVYNPVAPLQSLIALAPDDDAHDKRASDGWLTVGEVYGLDLEKADLVVLSACESQLGDLTAGDELVGLTRAFFFAGTPTVVASLWSVDDKATGLLMERFYTHVQAGMGKAEALRQAQIETREEYPNPYYWAAFVLSGDGGEPTSPSSTETPTPSSQDDPRGGSICPGAAIPLAFAAIVGIRRRRRKRARSR